ncbi:Phosphotransferase [Sulfidibacter corallicola]|uniref:Phosphotransferase n=1 Tax=Sulfidibacter corallicola TaxID=2818388 RepID=A0A8A4TT12_SULCO|nr:lipopolysaccharide kinase InaA family protein [Sulfidibacter corallicola]QTD52218.1 phosphotransferase [Sulfidibacter corallicola]
MLFLSPSWQHPDWARLPRRPLTTDGGRGQVALIEHPRGKVVARPYRHGGLRRLILPNHFLPGDRARREYAHHQRAFEAGVPTPEPVGWERRASAVPGLFHFSYFSAFLEDAVTVPRLLGQGPPTRDQLAMAADTLARLYRAGIFHSDLNLNNWLWADSRIWLIDFDRARPFEGDADSFLCACLNRMGRSAFKLGLTRYRLSFLRFVILCARAFDLPRANLRGRLKGWGERPSSWQRFRWKILGGHRQIG